VTRILQEPGRDAPGWFLRQWRDIAAAVETVNFTDLTFTGSNLTSLATRLFTDLQFTGSNLTSIETRAHADLQAIGEADDTDTDTVKDKHVSNAQAKGYADGVATAAAHIADGTGVHGASGQLIGAGNLATTLAAGVVVQGAAVADVASANAATQTAAYVQADVQSIATLAIDNKAQLNALLASLRAAGVIDT
jgi:hypothetical protein